MKNYLAILLLFNAMITEAQVGKTFPDVPLEDIHGGSFQSRSLFGEGYTLVGIGTSQKAEDDLRTWQAPVYNKFIAKTGLMDGMYDVKLYFIPLFTGAMQAAKTKVVKKLKENNEALVMDHVVIYTGPKAPFDQIGVDDKKEPYFLLINGQGKVVWMARGAFRQKHLDALHQYLIEN